MTEPSGAGAKLVIATATEVIKVIPKGVELLRAWFKGRRILIVGQMRAGKTTFVDYLQHGIFGPEKERQKTADPTESARFNLKIGPNKSLEMIVSKVVDTPGQAGAVNHANLAFEKKPHAIVVLLDLTKPLEGKTEKASGEWLKVFCKRLERLWRANRRMRNPIKTIIVVPTMVDKVDSEKVTEHQLYYKELLEECCNECRGSMLQDIEVMPATLVENPESQHAIIEVIHALAKALQ